MGNFIWTAILYFSTSTIVFLIYRTFLNDQKAENERKSADVVLKTQALIKAREAAAMRTPRRPDRRPTFLGGIETLPPTR
ncbi:MAG: hypothetical protein JWM91_1027 [Rhodospirillales bacterium]|nr:hypothetical protein [Rhodospirillales bacterium]